MLSDERLTKTAKKRTRLDTAVRRQQILVAALVEFTTLGFTAASLSKIASRAGTSKATLYVHVQNKDAIFETLLTDVLQPALGAWQPPPVGGSVEHALDDFIDQRYNDLTPQMMSILRLVIAEGHRVPALIQRWQEEIVLPAHKEQQAVIDDYVAKGVLAKTPLTDNFSFIMVPILYAAVCKLIFSPEVAADECQKTKATHRQVVRLLLTAR